MGKPIQLLAQSNQRFKIETKEVFKFLDKIANSNVAVISINGNKRTGKSFMLNYFLRYLYAQKTNKQNWISDNEENKLSGFEWRGGSERHTVGIWLWSESFTIKSKSGADIEILLMDTQGNFDEKTTFQECGLIFSLSALMSSTLILNMRNEISEDKLQFVEFFTFFAESFSPETKSNERLFQRLIFLIRDWESADSYSFGCHNDVTPKSKNYKREMIEPNDDQCLEAQNTRIQILSYFESVSSFLMPHPGKKVSSKGFNGQSDLIDDDFLEEVEKFVPFVFSSSNIQPKLMGGEILTGASLKAYIAKWAEIIATQKLPEARTLTQATADVNFMLGKNHALAMYEKKMRSHLERNANEMDFLEAHKQTEEESVNYFLTEPKGNIDEIRKSNLLEDLQNQINQAFVVLSTLNNARIERQESQKKLDLAIENQKQLKNEMTAQLNASIREQEALKNELQNVKNASENERRLIEEKAKMLEANIKLQNDMLSLKLEHLSEIADIEKSSLLEKLEEEARARKEAEKSLSDIKKPPPPDNSSCCIL